MNDKYYLTTPIYYVNDVPHIGSAYTTVATDVIARFMRLSGKEVKFLTGTDEHGQKVEKSAASKGMSAQSFVDTTSESFRKLAKVMNISNDDFIRTTEERHKETVRQFWQRLVESGDIYLGKYSGWYCVRDEAFYDETELTAEGLAPTGAAIEWVEETSYFFALSKWQDRLLKFYQDNPNFIRPQSRRNEVISFVKGGLHDLSISRTSFSWGIKVPSDEQHVVYVWLDALVNYISALSYPVGDDFKGFWPANVHVVGKDILRFHAVYWPAFLMAAGLELPRCIMAHGWWTNEGQKISKSLGNTIDPFQLVQEYGLDPVRYFLMREINFGNDGNFSRNNLVGRNNSELANKVGNLMQRTVSFIYKNNDGKVPEVSRDFVELAYQGDLLLAASKANMDNLKLMEEFDINGVLDNIIDIVEKGNSYIDHQAPWKLKDDQKKMFEVMYTLLENLRYVAIMLQPFVPDAAASMLDQLGIDESQREFKYLTQEHSIMPGSKLLEPKPILLRIEI